MEKLFKTDWEEDNGELLTYFWMVECEVDGVPSRWEDAKTDVRTVVKQPMFMFKNDQDSTPQMRWIPGREIDEEMWLKYGRLVEKPW